MIIELPVLPGSSGARRYRMGFFHFSNNNLALRAQCAQDIGGYDPIMRTSEDVDVCFRVALHPSWVACREPGVVVRHRNRRTVPAMVKQLWGWGINVGRAYRKTGLKGVHLYWVDAGRRTITRDVELPRVPLLTLAFVSSFHLAHVFVAVTLLSGALGWWPVTVGAALGAMALLRSFVVPILGQGLSVWMTTKLLAVSYLATLTFMTAAFLGGVRAGILLIPAPMFPTQRPTGQDAILRELTG